MLSYMPSQTFAAGIARVRLSLLLTSIDAATPVLHPHLPSLKIAHDSARVTQECFPEGAYYTYSTCCWCSDDGNSFPACWTDKFTFDTCCTFPFGTLASNSRLHMPSGSCYRNGQTSFASVRVNVGRFQPVIMQSLADRSLRLSVHGYLLAQMLEAGWIHSVGEGPPLRVLEVASALGLPSIVSALLGHHVMATDFNPEIVDMLKTNAANMKLHNMFVKTLDLSGRPGPQFTYPDVVILSGAEFFDANMSASVRLLCDANTRILITMRESYAKYYSLGSLKQWMRFFKVVSSVDTGWIERGLWLPSGYKMSAHELRPRSDV